MNKKLEVQAVMTPFPHSIGVDQSVNVARQMMREHGVRHLPVQKGNEIMGVLSHRDLYSALSEMKAEDSEIKVENIFTPEPYMVELNTPVGEVSRRMASEAIGCALVVEKGRLCGIFTTVDACRTLSDVLQQQHV